MTEIPDSLPARLELVGTTLYGRWWQRPLAQSMGVSALTMCRWHAGVRPTRPVDHLLLDALGRRGLKDSKQVAEVERLEKRMQKFVRSAA